MCVNIYNTRSGNDNQNRKEDKQENKMVQINGKEYVTVAERLEKLHSEHDKVGIETEVLRFDEEIVLVKAILSIDDKKFVGHAQEVIGSSEVNSTSALENAETSAVGRALAFAGLGVNGSIASADEIKKAEDRSRLSFDGETATASQLAKIRSLLDETLITAPEKIRIHKLLEGGGVLKTTASDLLSYFFGKSSIKNGSWDKITQGALSERRLSSKAA